MEALNFYKNISKLFKFDLDTCTRKLTGPPSIPSACLVGSWYVSLQRVHYQAFLQHVFIVIDIKPLIIVTN